MIAVCLVNDKSPHTAVVTVSLHLDGDTLEAPACVEPAELALKFEANCIPCSQPAPIRLMVVDTLL